VNRILPAIATILWFVSLNASAIEVGSIADSRFGEDWTLDGEEMTSARAKLLSHDNFGPMGTVEDTIRITDLSGAITTIALSTFDVFFIGYLDDSDSDDFSNAELDAFALWVEAGGTMIITCDDTSHDDVCDKFGPLPSESNASPPAEPTDAGVSHPIFDGPFGTVAELAMFGTRKYFADTAGFTVLAEDQSGNPIVLEKVIGDGRVIVFTDVDIISNDALSEGDGISNDSDRFLGNLIAYLADAAVETFLINAGVNGNWFGGDERRGEGVQFDVVLSSGFLTVVATFYTYDTEGNQIFLVAVGKVNGHLVDLDVFITEGGKFGSDFDTNDVIETQWGGGTLSIFNCYDGHLFLMPNSEYQALGYTNYDYDIFRLTNLAMPCPIAQPLIY